ncbi:MAG: signal peptidase II [Parcubacteria group bacterium]|nr:signal peptidase II [Parcubacteria group bacterium]
MNKRFWIYLSGLLILILDQLLKWFAIDFVEKGGFFIWKFFEFGLYKNEGIAFGIKIPQELFYILVAVIIYFIFEKFKKEIKKKDILVLFSLTLIGTGAISNIVDRIARGYVVDYLHFFNISAFNIADIVIVIGIGLLILKEIGLFQKIRRIRNKEL